MKGINDFKNTIANLNHTAEKKVEDFDNPVGDAYEKMMNSRFNSVVKEVEESEGMCLKFDEERLEADPNSMHLDEIRTFAGRLTEDEAIVIAGVMADKYSDILFTALRDKYESMMGTLNDISLSIGANHE